MLQMAMPCRVDLRKAAVWMPAPRARLQPLRRLINPLGESSDVPGRAVAERQFANNGVAVIDGVLSLAAQPRTASDPGGGPGLAGRAGVKANVEEKTARGGLCCNSHLNYADAVALGPHTLRRVHGARQRACPGGRSGRAPALRRHGPHIFDSRQRQSCSDGCPGGGGCSPSRRYPIKGGVMDIPRQSRQGASSTKSTH